MKVRIQAEELKTVLKRGAVATTIDSIKGSPYRGFGRITYSDNRLYVQSEGQSVSSKAYVSVDDPNAEEGACVCSLELILDMLKYMPKDQEIVIEYLPVEGSVGNVVVRSEKSSAEFGCAHRDLYMMMSDPSGESVFTIGSEEFFSSVSRVVFAGDKHDADNKRSNICIRSEGGRVYVAAARREMLCYSEVGDADFDMDIFIPLDIVNAISKFFLDGELKFVADGANMYLVQDRGWVRVCSQNVTGFPRFTAFSEHDTSGVSRLSVDSLKNCLGACMKANQIEGGAVISNGKFHICSMGTENGTKYKGHVNCSDDSDPVSDRITFSPFMVMGFFKGIQESTCNIEISKRSDNSSVVYMKLSDGSTFLFLKERRTMTTNPIEEIGNV